VSLQTTIYNLANRGWSQRRIASELGIKRGALPKNRRNWLRGWKEDPEILSIFKQRAFSDENGDVRQAAVQELARGWKEDPDTLSI
jgi:hypothetical protein